MPLQVRAEFSLLLTLLNSILLSVCAHAAPLTLEQRLIDLGYSEGVRRRLMTDPKASSLIGAVKSELEKVPVPTALLSPLRATSVYRGAMIFPSEYKPGFIGTIANKEHVTSYTVDLLTGFHYGRPVGWKEWMGDSHRFRGVVLELQLPRSWVDPDVWGRVLLSNGFDETPFVKSVGSWPFSTQYKESIGSRPIQFDFDEVYRKGQGLDEEKMVALAPTRPRMTPRITNLLGNCVRLFAELID